ncbi:MAG TPA: alcohol dehydrogenase catalytic domain-containing protein [Trueperaceae bacterium]|nr:alcohol dehydrogenase catalytic domain-containing protein [Trueperaceae bacterium]
MRAVLIAEPNAEPVLTTVADPEPGAHGAVIEVVATGVCRSDWHAWVGHDPTVAFPHVPGHEFAGIVRAVGPGVRRFSGGERVTAPFCCGCGHCGECRSGHQNLCEREYQPGFDGWGSFADYVMVPWADVNLVVLPDALGFEPAASLGCRFTTAYAGLMNHAGLRAGESVVVYGCGGVGLSAVMIAVAAGASVVAVDRAADRLALASDLGAIAVVDVTVDDPVAAVRDATRGGANVSVDALGSKVTSAQAIRSLRTRGRHVQLGLLLGDDASPATPLQDVVKRELVVYGGHGMQAWRYSEMFSFIESTKLPLERLVGAKRELAAAGEVLASMAGFAPLGVTLLSV